MLDRTNYNNINAINYSTLSKLHKHPRLLIAEPSAPHPGQVMGSLIDCLMLTPDEFDEKFYVSAAKTPSESMFNLLNEYLLIAGEGYYPINEEHVRTANSTVKLGGNWKIDTVIAKFKEACEIFLSEKQTAGNRLVADTQTVDRASRLVTSATTNKFVNEIMNPSGENGLIASQLAIVFYTRFLPDQLFKGLLDRLVIDVEKSKIIINDVKYDSGEMLAFIQSFTHWNYHLQVAMYRQAIEALLIDERADCSVQAVKDLLFEAKNYEIEFNFIVLSENFEPMIYRTTTSDYALGLYGGTLSNGIKKKGIIQLSNEYLRHKESNFYDYPLDIYDNKGIVQLGVSFVPLNV